MFVYSVLNHMPACSNSKMDQQSKKSHYVCHLSEYLYIGFLFMNNVNPEDSKASDVDF